MAEPSMDRATIRRQFAVDRAIDMVRSGMSRLSVLDLAALIEDYVLHGKRPS